MIDIRCGRWEDVLAGETCDAIVTDCPYSSRTHEGHDDGVTDRGTWTNKHGQVVAVTPRRTITYTHWTDADVNAFVDSWAPRNRGWFVCLSDHALCRHYEAAFERHGLTTFAPVSMLIPGMTVRMNGDGPSSWTIYANVARPKALSKWGTLPGGYTGPPGERVHIGGKPLWLARALVRDYSRKGDIICDPCAGAGSTLLAAAMENRRAIGAEVDPATFEIAQQRIRAGYTPSLDFGA